MEIDQYLNPDDIRYQCEEASAKLEQDNEALANTASAISSFSNDEEISSKAYDALKQQLSDYLEIISSMTAANQVDYEDFGTLSESVGDEVLDGSKIIPCRDKAENDMNEHNAIADSYSGMASGQSDPILSYWYTCLSNLYRQIAESDRKSYLKWKEKADRYDEIEALTSELFAATESVRTSLADGMSMLGTAFTGGCFEPKPNAVWIDRLSEALDKDIGLSLVKNITKALFEKGYTIYDIEEMDDDSREAVLCDTLKDIAAFLPTVKLEEKVEIPLSPNTILEYAVEGKMKGRSSEINLAIEDNKMKFKNFGFFLETDDELGDIKGKVGVKTDGETAASLKTDKFKVATSNYSDGRVSLALSAIDGDTTYTLKRTDGFAETSYEASVETKLPEKEDSIKSKLVLTTNPSIPGGAAPIDVTDNQFEVSTLSTQELGEYVCIGTVAFLTVKIIAGIILAPETGGASLVFCIP